MERPRTRDQIATLLWSHSDEDRARHSLRQCLVDLRHVLADDEGLIIVSDGDRLELGSPGIDVDIQVFGKLVSEDTRADLERAIELYAGDLLDGLSVGSEGFDEWLAEERSRLKNEFANTLYRLASLCADAGDGDAAIAMVLRLVDLDPLREEACQLLMRLYAESGRRSAALRQYQVFEELLLQELDTEPEPETRHLRNEINEGRIEPQTAKESSSATVAPDPRPATTASPLATTSSSDDKPSVAVMPFDNISGDPEQTYFADGITIELITSLSKISGLHVVGRQSAFAYREKDLSVKQTCDELGVGALIQGSVRRSGQRVRIAAQLIGQSGVNLWAESYERMLDDVFDVQDEVTRQIAKALEVTLTDVDDDRLTHRRPRDIDAYDLLLRGREQLLRHTNEGNERALKLFEEAIRIDQDYAPAYALMAETHLRTWQFGESNTQALRRAFELAQRAVDLDDQLGSAHGVLGQVYTWLKQHDTALGELQKQVSLYPNDPDGHVELAVGLVWAGQAEAAVSSIETAIRLNPRCPFWYLTGLGFAYFALRRYDEVVDVINRSIAINPQSMPNHLILASSFAHLGQSERAAAEAWEIGSLVPGLTLGQLDKVAPFARREDLDRFLDGLRLAGLPADESEDPSAEPGAAQARDIALRSGKAAPAVVAEIAPLARTSPRPRRLRVWISVAAVVVLAGALIWWWILPQSDTVSLDDMELPLPSKPSIAVLPFDNLSGDPAQEYFVDGMTEEIITELSRFAELFVIARNSTFVYKGKAVKPQKVSRELGVRYVLEGSVQKDQSSVRINAQLIDATRGHHLWAERFDRQLKDVFALQDEVAEKIAAAVGINVTDAETKRTKRMAPGSLEAYEAVLRGREYLFDLTKDANANARGFFERAVALDPNYARAHAYLAWTHLNDWRLGWSNSPETIKRAFALARKAVTLDQSDPAARSALGDVFLWTKRHDQAIATLQSSIELNPNSDGHYAILGDALTWAGQPQTAIENVETAMRLNPHYPVTYLWYLGHAHFVSKRCDDSNRLLEQARDRNPDFLAARLYLAACYALLDRMEPASVEIAEALKRLPVLTTSIMQYRLPYKNQEDLLRILSALRKAGLPE